MYTPPQSPRVVPLGSLPGRFLNTTGFSGVPRTSSLAPGKMTMEGFMPVPPGFPAFHAIASPPPQSPRTLMVTFGATYMKPGGFTITEHIISYSPSSRSSRGVSYTPPMKVSRSSDGGGGGGRARSSHGLWTS